MKTTILFLISSLFFFGPLWSQQLLNLNPRNSCSYYGEEITDEVYGFASSSDAERSVEEIVGIVGLRPNFEIKAGNVPNAVATIQDGKRLIVYSQDFMLKIRDRSGDDWASVSILAHEIGHHLNGHTITEGGSRPTLELESDEFSGFILGKMGASLEQAQAAIAIHASSRGSSTHPPRSARLEAIAVGWNKATEGERRTTPPRRDVREKPDTPADYPPTIRKDNPTHTTTPATTTVTLAYAGDQYGCGLPIQVNIGGVTFTPRNNAFQVTNIPAGQQSYTISGMINCTSIGSCEAQGSGVITVRPNATYWITWQNTAVGYCRIWLMEE